MARSASAQKRLQKKKVQQRSRRKADDKAVLRARHDKAAKIKARAGALSSARLRAVQEGMGDRDIVREFGRELAVRMIGRPRVDGVVGRAARREAAVVPPPEVPERHAEPTGEWLTAREAAEPLGISAASVRRWASSGKLESRKDDNDVLQVLVTP